MTLRYKDINIFYTDEGSGKPIVLLHGFLEDHSMWDSLKPPLLKTHRIITIDLLGHGKTGCLSRQHTMVDKAEAIKAVIKYLHINKPLLIGHSMGGYVGLAYAEKYAEQIEGLCLVNSTYKADSANRKELRAKANKMITNNFESMVRISFANLFSKSSKTVYKKEFEAALTIALQTSIKGYIAANDGMRVRKDYSYFFKNATFKKAIILGKKDAVINYKSISNFCKKHQINYYLCSEGHMSYIENKTELENYIMHFVEKN